MTGSAKSQSKKGLYLLPVLCPRSDRTWALWSDMSLKDGAETGGDGLLQPSHCAGRLLHPGIPFPWVKGDPWEVRTRCMQSLPTDVQGHLLEEAAKWQFCQWRETGSTHSFLHWPGAHSLFQQAHFHASWVKLVPCSVFQHVGHWCHPRNGLPMDQDFCWDIAHWSKSWLKVHLDLISGSEMSGPASISSYKPLNCKQHFANTFLLLLWCQRKRCCIQNPLQKTLYRLITSLQSWPKFIGSIEVRVWHYINFVACINRVCVNYCILTGEKCVGTIQSLAHCFNMFN